MVQTTNRRDALRTGGPSERGFTRLGDEGVASDGGGEEAIMEASPLGAGGLGRGAFWPTCELYHRVPLDQRWRLLFDRGPSGAPESCLGWTDAQRDTLARHAVAVRRWLHPILGRLPSRDELALVVGVEVDVLNRALDDDGRRIAAAVREQYEVKRFPRDWGMA